MTNWIETQGGKQLNADRIDYFEVSPELERAARAERLIPTGKYFIEARTTHERVVVRTFDTEDEAKHGLQTLIESLVGVQHQAGVTVVTPGAAFPGRDTTRIVADGVKIADAGTWRRANGFS